MLEPIIGQILSQGHSLEDAVREAQSLAREAYRSARSLQCKLDGNPRTRTVREDLLEPLLRKEREVIALSERVAAGGSRRTSDSCQLSALLRRRQREYEILCLEIPYHQLCREFRGLVEAYLEARRKEIYLGDAERFRRAVFDYLNQAALAS